MKYLSRTVWILSFVSLLTDTASEMLCPVMPAYLRSIGFSVLLIGVLEGLAEASAGLSKGYFGKLSDHRGRRVPFVQAGYALSALSKPLMAAFIAPMWVFVARTLDRLGKGLRTGARDAILAGESTPAIRGRIFGFHRSMDTLGAVAGPLLALLWLQTHPGDYRNLFFIAFLPGLLAIVATLLLREKATPRPAEKTKTPGFLSFLRYWKESPPNYRRLSGGLLVFALFNSSDLFLLMQAKESGLSDSAVIGAYIFYNLIYALFAFPLGMLADRIGLKKVLLGGLIVFAAVYGGMAYVHLPVMLYALFFLYGIYAAATEGISKAWISGITDKKDTATAIGTFAGFQSICALLASSLTGLLWYHYGPVLAFSLTSVVSIAVAAYLAVSVPAPAAE